MEYQNIRQIAFYEFKIVTRDWSFRIISLIGILIVLLLHILTQSNFTEPEWVAISLSSAIPLANAYLINYLQIFIIIFWAGNFVQKKQFDIYSSIYIRPFTNLEWIWGKVFGFIIVMLVWIFLLACTAGGIHLFFSNSPFAIFPYLFYFITLTFPILIFTTSIVLCVKEIIQSKMMALLFLIILFYFEIVFSGNILHGGLDLLATTLPNIFSEITGFSNLCLYLLQRSTFILWGIGFILLGAYLAERLPNDTREQSRLGKWSVLFLLLGCLPFGIYITTYIEQQERRDDTRAVFARYENLEKIIICDHRIRFEQKGKTYTASSLLTIENPNLQVVDSVILYLNPGLDIISLSDSSHLLNYRREKQVVVIRLRLVPGERRILNILYEGAISPDVCYAEIKDTDSQADIRNYYIFNTGRDFYYLTPNFTLLTPECLWYPTAIAPVNVLSPYETTENYTQFQLSVVNNPHHVAISQGEKTEQIGISRFTSKEGLPGLSLCIGDYVHDSIMIDDIWYELFLLKGHENLLHGLDPLKVHELWSLAYKFNNDLDYGFKKLNIVEVPVHFCAYPRDWRNRSEYVQAEIIFRPEREALFPMSFRVENWSSEQEPESYFYGIYQTYLLNNRRNIPTGNLFLNKLTGHLPGKEIKNENDISFLLRKWHYHVISSEFRGINLIFQELQSQWESARSDYMNWRSSSCEYFENHNLEDIFLNSNTDFSVDDAIYWKTRQLLRYLLCFVPFKDFYSFHQRYIEQHIFQTFSYESYCEEFKKRFEVDLIDITRQLYQEKGLAAFQIRGACVQRVKTPHGDIGFVQSIKVRNTGTTGGIITLSRGSATNVHYFIPAGTCKEIRNYIQGNLENFDFEIKTNLSKNRPSYYAFFGIEPRNIISTPRPGIYDSDTLIFLPKAGEFIVDNTDPGFHIEQDSLLLKKVLAKRKGKKQNTETQWKQICMPGSYGEPIQSYHIKLAGNSLQNVVWQAYLPESGIYELYIYNTDLSMIGQGQQYVDGKLIEQKEPIQIYQFNHSNGEEEIKLETKLCGSGWVSLGEFQFNAGSASIKLLDRGVDEYQYIYADAVKWVRKFK